MFSWTVNSSFPSWNPRIILQFYSNQLKKKILDWLTCQLFDAAEINFNVFNMRLRTVLWELFIFRVLVAVPVPSQCLLIVKFIRSIMYVLINSTVGPSRSLPYLTEILEKLGSILTHSSVLLNMSQKKKDIFGSQICHPYISSLSEIPAGGKWSHFGPKPKNTMTSEHKSSLREEFIIVILTRRI